MKQNTLIIFTLVIFTLFVWASFATPALGKIKTDPLPNQSTETQKKNFGYDKGLYFKTDDFSLRLNIMAKIRYQYEYFNNQPDNNTFALRLARIDLNGSALDDKLTLRFMPGFDNNANASILDLYFNYRFCDAFQIQAGQYKVPFSREYTSSALHLVPADWTNIVNDFGLNRDIGLNIHGNLAKNKFEYNVYAFNGNNRAVANSNKSIILGTRLNVNLLGRPGTTLHDLAHSETPQWAVGLAAVYDLGSDLAAIAGNELIRLTLDTIFKYQGLTWETEGHYLRNTVTDDSNYGVGAQGNVFIMAKKLALGAHADIAWRNGAGALGDGAVDTWSAGTAINYFIDADRFKLTLDYTFYNNESRVQDMKDHQMTLQAQFYY